MPRIGRHASPEARDRAGNPALLVVSGHDHRDAADVPSGGWLGAGGKASGNREDDQLDASGQRQSTKRKCRQRPNCRDQGCCPPGCAAVKAASPYGGSVTITPLPTTVGRDCAIST